MPFIQMPILALLTPPPGELTPEGFTRLDVNIIGGLPFTLRLSDQYNLLLVMPTGLAALWRDADSGLVISSSTDQRQPVAEHALEPVAEVSRPPLQLFVQRGRTMLGAFPLAVSRAVLQPEGQTAGLEILILSWELRAGNMRGPGNFGSRLALAWRATEKASAAFSPPAVHPAALRRQPPLQ